MKAEMSDGESTDDPLMDNYSLGGNSSPAFRGNRHRRRRRRATPALRNEASFGRTRASAMEGKKNSVPTLESSRPLHRSKPSRCCKPPRVLKWSSFKFSLNT